MERKPTVINPDTFRKRALNHHRRKQIETAYKNQLSSYADACKIMEMLMPKETPIIPGYDVAAIMEPSKEFSGDLYVIPKIEGGKFAILVGDVAGKDLGASFIAFLTRILFEKELQYNIDPRVVTEKVNKELTQATKKSTIFVTSILAILEPNTGRITSARAGHQMPRKYKDGNPYDFFPEESHPLNFDEDENFKIQELNLNVEKGEILVLASDGVTETHNPEGKMLGNDGLDEIIKKYMLLPANQMLEKVMKEVRAFEGNPLEPHDDRTMVILKRL